MHIILNNLIKKIEFVITQSLLLNCFLFMCLLWLLSLFIQSFLYVVRTALEACFQRLEEALNLRKGPIGPLPFDQ